ADLRAINSWSRRAGRRCGRPAFLFAQCPPSLGPKGGTKTRLPCVLSGEHYVGQTLDWMVVAQALIGGPSDLAARGAPDIGGAHIDGFAGAPSARMLGARCVLEQRLVEHYQPHNIEAHWQRVWQETGLYEVDLQHAKRPFYNLLMFPYPSAEGLHVGNVYAYTGGDVFGRFMA